MNSRREFLSLALLSPLILSCSTRRKESAQTNFGKVFITGVKDSTSSYFWIWDMDSDDYHEYVIPLTWPHSAFRDVSGDAIYIFEMYGSAVKLDLRTSKSLKIAHQNELSKFLGHGLQTNSGEFIYSVELTRDMKKVFRKRSSVDLSIVDSVEGVVASHHVVKLKHSDVGVVSNWGEKDISFFELSSGKLLNKVKVGEKVTHFKPLSDSDVIGVTMRGLGGGLRMNRDFSSPAVNIFHNPGTWSGSPLVYAGLNGKFQGHMDSHHEKDLKLGLAIDEVPGSKKRFITGHLESGRVVLWEEFKVVKSYDIPLPYGAFSTADGAGFVVHSNDEVRLYSFEEDRPVKVLKLPSVCSMIYRYS